MGLAVAVAADLRGRRAWAVVACAAAALLVSPLSWSHHWVWCVPMALLLGRTKAAAAGTRQVFCSYALWWVPHGPGRLELWQNEGELTLSALYGGAAFVFLAVAGVALWRIPGRSQAVANE